MCRMRDVDPNRRDVAARESSRSNNKTRIATPTATAAIFRHDVGAVPVERPDWPLAKKRNTRS